MSGVEIERKFLVPEPPDLGRWPSTQIDQGYLAIDPDGTEVRVRRREGEAVLTVKGPGSRSRIEEEIAIDGERFRRLWELTQGRRLQKTRHVAPGAGDLRIEIDVYHGDLAPLVVAEVEFGSEHAAEAFEPPDWFGPEVTDDPRYKNQRLACYGAPVDSVSG